MVVAEHVRLRQVELRGDQVGLLRDESQLDPRVARVPRFFSRGVVDVRLEVLAGGGAVDDLDRHRSLEAKLPELLDGGAHLAHQALGLCGGERDGRASPRLLAGRSRDTDSGHEADPTERAHRRPFRRKPRASLLDRGLGSEPDSFRRAHGVSEVPRARSVAPLCASDIPRGVWGV